MLTEKGRARHKMLMEAVWKAFEEEGGITVGRLVEVTRISSYQMYTALWTLQRKGLIRPEWSPTGKGKRGSMYVVLPGARAWKIRFGQKAKKLKEVKILEPAKTLTPRELSPEHQARVEAIRAKYEVRQ